MVKNHPFEKKKYISNDPTIEVVESGLGWCVENCEFVVGVNSGVLYEASLIFEKPVYYYGRSWYDNHPMVCKPANGELCWYEVTEEMKTYRRRFWTFMISKQLDYSKSFDDERLIRIIKNEMLHK